MDGNSTGTMAVAVDVILDRFGQTAVCQYSAKHSEKFGWLLSSDTV